MILVYEIAFDCVDPDRVAGFWRTALDYVQRMPSPEEIETAYRAHPEWRDIAIVEDELARHPRLYLQRVREPKVGRNRITFEVTLPEATFDAERERLRSLGATSLDQRSWWADPEGNEFEIRPGDGPRRFSAVVIDALEPARLADFWGAMFEFEVGTDRCDPPRDWLAAQGGALIVRGQRLGLRVPGEGHPPDGPVHALTPGFRFRPTKEPKLRKNRIHFDLVPTDVEGDRARAFALGASPEDLPRTGHRGMFDPEGNEFCLHDDAMFA